MKIAILSMHRVINWGSFLQAYALRQLLLQNGADMVSFIDIKPGRPLKGFEPETKKDKIYRYIGYFFQGRFYEKLQGWRYFNKVQESIESHWPLLNIDEKGTAYDLAIIGSDEVFNCCQTTSWGYTLQLYGAISEAKKSSQLCRIIRAYTIRATFRTEYCKGNRCDLEHFVCNLCAR